MYIFAAAFAVASAVVCCPAVARTSAADVVPIRAASAACATPAGVRVAVLEAVAAVRSLYCWTPDCSAVFCAPRAAVRVSAACPFLVIASELAPAPCSAAIRASWNGRATAVTFAMASPCPRAASVIIDRLSPSWRAAASAPESDRFFAVIWRTFSSMMPLDLRSASA